MNVTFEIERPNGPPITETDLADQFEALRGSLSALTNPPGALLFDDPERKCGTALSDTLEMLIVNVCLYAVPTLLAGKEVVVDYFSSPTQLRLVPEGDEVAFYEDGQLIARFPLAELAPALRACGERYAAYLTKLHGDDPNWKIRLNMVQAAVLVSGNPKPAGNA